MFRKLFKQIIKLFVDTTLDKYRAEVKTRLIEDSKRTDSSYVKIRNNVYLSVLDSLDAQGLDAIIDTLDNKIKH